MPSSCKREIGIEGLKTRHGQTRDDGESDDHLGDDHRSGCVNQLHEADGPAAPEENRHEQTHHHRRQAHAGIDQGNRRAAPGKSRKRESDAERNTDQERN